MIELLLFLMCIAWFFWQFRPKPAARWKKRVDMLGPFGRHLRDDARAAFQHISTARLRRRFRKGL